MTTPSEDLDVEGLVERLEAAANIRSEDAPAELVGLCDQAAAYLQSLHSRLRKAEGERDEANDAEVRWIGRVSDIREASGVGVKPMLAELPAAIAAKIATSQSEAAALRVERDEAYRKHVDFDNALAASEAREAALRERVGECADAAIGLAEQEGPMNAPWEQYARSRLRWIADRLRQLLKDNPNG